MKKLRLQTFLLALVLLLALHNSAQAQIGAGGAFLKILPGARNQSMATSLTGAIDDMHALYANPGATGFLRAWQLSSAYTEWIADTYNLSVIYGRHLVTPWSNRSRMALGIQYQGIREFDSTSKAQAAASANDLLVTASIGSPFTLLSRNISAGANVKYFRSTLADLSASSWLFDFGLMYRSNRFRINNRLLDFGVISGGVAVNHLGSSLRFISHDTPLPRTVRAGAALSVGTHDGLQIQFTTDYQKVRDEAGGFSLGTEVAWSYRFAVRAGYSFNDNLLSKFAFGLSFRLDDYSSPVKSVLPGQNNATRVDVAGLEKSDYFATSFFGGINLYPIAPERFEFVDPYMKEQIRTNEMTLPWSTTRDPDLYDDVNYLLLISRHANSDSADAALTTIIEQINRTPQEFLDVIERNRSPSFSIIDSGFDGNPQSGQLSYSTSDLSEGEYAWTVMAFDQDNHVQFAQKDGDYIRHFRISPILEITSLDFIHNKWITEDDYQGELRVRISNKGRTDARNDTLSIYGSLVRSPLRLHNGENGGSDHPKPNTRRRRVAIISIDRIPAGSDTTISVKWHARIHGEHRIVAQIRKYNQITSDYRTGASLEAICQTVPKGIVRVQSEVARIDSVYDYELPFISKIFFAKNSIKYRNTKTCLMYSPLETLANRIASKPNVQLRLRGYVDATIGEPELLAFERAQVVRERLVELGVSETLITIPQTLTPGQVNLHVNPKLGDDWRWVEEERRYVEITAHEIGDEEEEIVDLFQSVALTLPKASTFSPIEFISTVNGFVPIESARLELDAGDLHDVIGGLDFVTLDRDTISWMHYSEETSEWLSNNVTYTLRLRDRLGREFMTPVQEFTPIAIKHNLLPHKIIVGVADFTQDTPSTNLYWSHVIEKVSRRLQYNDSVRMQFIGHACEIGASSINDSLAIKRARKFQSQFMYEIEKQAPGLVERIEASLDEFGGRGKTEPFQFEIERNNFLSAIKNKSLQEYQTIRSQIDKGLTRIKFDPFILIIGDKTIKLISNNGTTFGRQINRRIEILIKNSPATQVTSSQLQAGSN